MAGTMIAPGWGTAIGAVVGGAGGLMTGIGAGKEAKRKARALEEYKRKQAEIYDAMVKDAWSSGVERQDATGQQIGGLTKAMSTPATVAPQTADFIDTAPSGRGAAYDNVLQNAMKPRAVVDQANLNATQAGLDRAQLSRVLDQLGYSSSIEGQVNAPAHTRLQWKKQQELAEAQAALDEILGSTDNASQNLLLGGQLIGTGLQLGGMAGAMSGPAPSANLPGSGGAPLAPGAAGPVGASGPASVYDYFPRR
jgi:hypothetical protein